jgi:hypothetical protein
MSEYKPNEGERILGYVVEKKEPNDPENQYGSVRFVPAVPLSGLEASGLFYHLKWMFGRTTREL